MLFIKFFKSNPYELSLVVCDKYLGQIELIAYGFLHEIYHLCFSDVS